MTRRRDLGPYLAAGTAIVAVAAMITGFIVVGGPGDARDKRFDEQTEERILQVATAVDCAFDTTGVAPVSYEAATKVSNAHRPMTCGDFQYDPPTTVTATDQPAEPGAIGYVVLGPASVKVCGNFRRAASEGTARAEYPFGRGGSYPQLVEPRPAGVHCYVLDLKRRPPAPADAY